MKAVLAHLASGDRVTLTWFQNVLNILLIFFIVENG